MTKKELTVAILALFIAACVSAYTTTSSTAARVDRPAGRSGAQDGGAHAIPAAASAGLDDDGLGDPDNCGCCGARCASDEVCLGGACVSHAATCTGGCNPNVYVCNPVADRCVGNGSRTINLCRWDDIVDGTALPCGTSATVTVVDACHDGNNCGNCGIACPTGRCFWGVCE